MENYEVTRKCSWFYYKMKRNNSTSLSEHAWYKCYHLTAVHIPMSTNRCMHYISIIVLAGSWIQLIFVKWWEIHEWNSCKCVGRGEGMSDEFPNTWAWAATGTSSPTPDKWSRKNQKATENQEVQGMLQADMQSRRRESHEAVLILLTTAFII